jgi:hypothetical protein
VHAGSFAAGVSTENGWWGPGRWNALLLSTTAEGFPHLFARTRRPLRTALGDVELRYLLGALTASTFSDTALVPGQRALNGLAATLRPTRLPNLTVGIARTVVTPLDRWGDVPAQAANVATRWDGGDDLLAPVKSDQLTALTARWLFPREHAELYAEWARQQLPRSTRELLLAPHEGQGYTLGARALRPLGGTASRPSDRYLRLEVELTNTEQSIAFRDRPVPRPFYTGLSTREGYTQRGQLIGAGTGPGSSAQWIGTDLITSSNAVGLVLGRIRWENDALYDQSNANFFRHDVSTLVGIRARRRLQLVDVRGEATWAKRYNYLFQNGLANPGGRRTVDVTNLTFMLAVEPR